MIDTLAFKKIFFIYKRNIFFLSLVALYLELFPAQAVITFLVISKSANTNLHCLTLGCNVSETPSNVAIYRKYPSPTIPAKKFNPKGATFLYKSFELKNENCSNMAGQYECVANFLHKVAETKTLNVFRDDCQLILCDAKLNNSVTYATLGDDVNLTTCVMGTNEATIVELYDNQDRHSLKYLISHDHNTTTKYRNITAQIMKLSPSGFGLYKMKIKLEKYADQSLVINFQILQKEHPTLCDGTSIKTDILAVNNKATTKICVKSGDPISNITMNDFKVFVFDHGLIQSSQYRIINKTEDGKIYFTIELLNLTLSSPDKYVVKIVTTSNLQLVLQFNVKINSVSEISPDCFTSKNATSLHVVNNTVTIYMCVNETGAISRLEVNDRPINDTVSEYTIKNKTVVDNTQVIVEFRNLKKGIDRNVSFGVTKLSGQNIQYFFDLTFHYDNVTVNNEVSAGSSNTDNSSFIFVLPILGIVIFLVIITLIVYLKFKSKKRRQRYGQAYDNVTYKSSESMIRPGPLPSYRGSSLAAGRDSNRPKVPPRNRPLRK